MPHEPNLLRLYLRHCAVGFALSAIFVALILWANVGNLTGLILGSDIGWRAVFLLWFFHGTLFGGLQFAVMVMLNVDRDDDDGVGGFAPGVDPIPVLAKRRT